jgi:hypothetical protein
MSRIAFVLADAESRDEAARLCMSAPEGTYVEFKDEARTRTELQNKKMWPMLTEISRQVSWPPYPQNGVQLSPEDWKLIMLDALGHEMRLIPNAGLNGFVNLGRSSSVLKVGEFRDLIEIIYAFGAQHGVKFREPKAEPEPDQAAERERA